MNTFKTALILIITTSGYLLNAQDLKLNASQSGIEWTGKAAFNSYTLTGTLEAKKGKVLLTDNTITELEVIIDMKSLDHENGDLKKHLRSKDFFEVNTYTTATFKISQPALIANNKARLVGNMTIKGITKKEIIEVSIREKTMMFNHIMDRTTFGITFNSPNFFKKMKDNAIADAFILKGSLYFE